MASRFEFAILDKATGKVIVKTEPRDTADIVEKFLEALAARGVGLFRTTTHVKADARQALEQVIFELKAKVVPHEV